MRCGPRPRGTQGAGVREMRSTDMPAMRGRLDQGEVTTAELCQRYVHRLRAEAYLPGQRHSYGIDLRKPGFDINDINEHGKPAPQPIQVSSFR